MKINAKGQQSLEPDQNKSEFHRKLKLMLCLLFIPAFWVLLFPPRQWRI